MTAPDTAVALKPSAVFHIASQAALRYLRNSQHVERSAAFITCLAVVGSHLNYETNKQLSSLLFAHPQRQLELVIPGGILKHLALHRRHLMGVGPMAADTPVQMRF